MTETIVTDTTGSLLQYGAIGAVLLLSLIALFWMVKKILSDKDKTIDILRQNVEKRDGRLEKLLEHNSNLSNSIEKLVDTIKENHSRNTQTLDKITAALDDFKDKFNSLPCKFRGSNT